METSFRITVEEFAIMKIAGVLGRTRIKKTTDKICVQHAETLHWVRR